MYNETYLAASIFAALVVYMVDYGLGQPGNDKWKHSDLLSFYSFFIAKKTLQMHSAWDDLHAQYVEQIKNAQTPVEVIRIKQSFKDIVFSQARELFTWQKALGMCPICFHFWICSVTFTIVNIFCQKENIIIFTLYFLFSHLLIRILKKYF